jgi:F-type H+-transporting ATPase subunit epsilon
MANTTHAELITPERVLFSGNAEAVVMRTDGGDITFLANHMDYIAAVDICVVHFEGVRADGAPPEAGAPVEPVATGAPSARGEASSESASGREVRAAVHGGFVMVAENKVTIVSGVAELAEEIDVARAERALAALKAEGADPEAGAALAPATAGVAPDGLSAVSGDDPEVTARNAAAARARARLQAAARLESNLSRM